MGAPSWACLIHTRTLVDAPGVGDDNTARDGIVKTYIKEADAIWIVSNIKRAVNDKAAKNMLGESFRRQLLMDGQYGQLLFLATQSDVIVRSEIAKSLGLSSAAPLPTIAAARNEYTRKRIQRLLRSKQDRESTWAKILSYQTRLGSGRD